MSKIQAISMENLKGTIDKQLLTGKDIFIGRNGSGKTTRLQALQMSMLGYVPGNGKRAVDNYKFSSDDNEMSVGLELEDFKFSRTFERSTKMTKGVSNVTISESITVSPCWPSPSPA
ncbi:AAA family ATPase [uncultured Brevibacillus sp.]|uniref:AAA family ATPase n=1 Tax=uncultured Brevibacillus sp. TaxID=169970 RepID=UPI00259419EC|nr:AAA family ATPase [uncultured Brevibacillus sp.]